MSVIEAVKALERAAREEARRRNPTLTRNRVPPLFTLTLLREEAEAHARHGKAVWNPACGAGDIARVLEEEGWTVQATDDGPTPWGTPGIPFMDHPALLAPSVICFPPGRQITDYVLHALALGAEYVAVLARSWALGGAARWESLYSSQPPNRILWYSSMMDLQEVRGGIEQGMRAMIWLVWEPGMPREPLRWIPDSGVPVGLKRDVHNPSKMRMEAGSWQW